jgi:hypothetical protein
MHRYPHIVRLVALPKQAPRPAKIVQLDARRQARLEAERATEPRPRPAA